MIKEVEKYKAIAEEVRLRIIRVLIEANMEMCACELVDIVGRPQYNISKNLSILKKAELVEERRDGKLMMFRIKNDNDFNIKLFENISKIKSDSHLTFKDDFKKLKDRLDLRVDGKIVVTYRDNASSS